MRSILAPTVLLLLGACASTKQHAIPRGMGEGVIAFDPAPPAGSTVRVYQPPAWGVGDTFVLLRGSRVRLPLKVVRADDTGYELTDPAGGRIVRDRDLAVLGEGPPGAELLHVLAPRDARYHWPLWVGKKWKQRFVDSTAGGESLPLEVSSEVEGVERVTVAAGSFECLRIRRTSRLLLDGEYYDRTTYVWYAPDPGFEVRQLVGETEIELAEWQRAPIGAAPAAPR